MAFRNIETMSETDIENTILGLMLASENVFPIKYELSLDVSKQVDLAIRRLIDKGFIICSPDGFSAVITHKGKQNVPKTVRL